MHVAIIMNGNGRWAMKRGLPPTAGCIEGAAALRTTVELALRTGVKTLTVYAICCVDSERSVHELDADLRVPGGYLRTEARRCAEQAVRISVIGNCKRLGAAAQQFHNRDDESSNGMRSRLHLRIVIDSGGGKCRSDSATRRAVSWPEDPWPSRISAPRDSESR